MGITHSRRAQRAFAALTAATLGATGLAAVAAPAVASEPTADPRVDTVYTSAIVDRAVSYPSVGFASNSTRELGDHIRLAGEARVLESVSVGMNSWACESGSWTEDCVTTPGASYSHPVTLHLYTVEDGEPGEEIAAVEQTFDVPFRPSAAGAEVCDGSTTQWYDAEGDTCQNGFSFPIEFDLAGLDIEVPSDVVVSVTYPTSRFGELEETGPYDSLNVELPDTAPSIGTDVNPAALMVDSTWADMYGDGGPTGVFRSTADWAGYALDLTVTAVPAAELIEVSPFVADFESADAGVALVDRVPGYAMSAAAGCWYGEAPVTNYGTHGTEGFVVTKYAGYASAFPEGGYTASADFYLDTALSTGGERRQFSWSHAVNGTDGKHQRDFVFHVTAEGDGTWTVGVNNGATTTAPYISTVVGEAFSISESGWYTLQHVVRAGEDGLLHVDMNLIDGSGVELASWTLGGNAADVVPTIVGGNRYGWLVNNAFAGLAIDNVVLGAERPTGHCAPFYDVTNDSASGFFTPHAGEILWMKESGLSKGWTTAHGVEYRPWTATTREAYAAFLYRQAGSPALKSADWPFIDVSPIKGSPHYSAHWKAIIWMGQEGLSTGWDTPAGKEFRPTIPIKRDQLAAFMWRQAGSPVPTIDSPFADVSLEAGSAHHNVFAEAIVWMYESGLSQGWTVGDAVEYRPLTSTTRDAMAAFLYRAAMRDL